MSGRDRVNVRAQRIYEFLRDRQGQPFKKDDLYDALDLNDSKTTRSAVGRARELAEEDGLYLTVPVYDNGFTLAVTDDASAAVDPAMWLARVEHGVAVPRHIADDFMRSRMSKLNPSDRAYIHLQDKTKEMVETVQAAADELAKAHIEDRRQRRQQERQESEVQG